MSRLDSLVELDEAYCSSTRIRIARNLKDFPLGTIISTEERDQVEQFAVKAFESLNGTALEGKYYKLGDLTNEERTQLIQDHFLFKEGDRFLEACGLNRDWPRGRGIYHNNEKTFLVWVKKTSISLTVSGVPFVSSVVVIELNGIHFEHFFI